MRRLPFLPLFFIALSIVFVIALVVRLRRDIREANRGTATIASPPAADVGRASARPPEDGLKPVPQKPAPQKPVPQKPAPQKPFPQGPGPHRPVPQNPPAVPRPEPQSVIARVFAPIVKALSGGGSTPSKPPSGSSSTSQPSSQQQPSQGQNPSLHAPEKEAPKDPNSDTTPPQLVSIEFVPPQVHDGEEARIVVTAVDDLSGIRGISGTMSSPTGKALQGFATQREGDTNRYAGRVAIAKNSEEGLWRVNYLNMSDNASNSVTLSYAQGSVPPSAVLRVVSSNSDSTPPTLKNIWVDRRAMRGGEKDIVFVEAIDDNSGVNLVSCVFQSPSKIARIGAGCSRGEGDVWRCELSVPACVDCGDWQLEQVTLQDKANNLATFRLDNPLVQAVKVNIQGDSCDSTPPTLQSLVLDSNDIAVGSNGAVAVVTVVATDDICGVSGVSGQFIGPGPGSGGFFPLQQSGDTWTGRIQLDARAARGLWRINSIQLTDRAHNLRIYYANDPVLQNGAFRLR